MPRRKLSKKRVTAKDPVFNSFLVAKLINQIMRSGKKSIARRHVYGAFEIVKKKLKTDPLTVFETVLNNIRPRVEVKSRRVGGAAYQVPLPVRAARQNSLAIRWLVAAARAKPNKEYHTFTEKLATELIDAFKETGGAMSKKQEIEKVAVANKAFSHLRW